MEQPIGPRITGLEHKAEEIKKAVDRMTQTNHSGNQNVTNVRFEGGKSIVFSVALGLVGGVCLGVSVAVVGWVGWALSDIRDTDKNQDAFIQAVYTQAPWLEKPEAYCAKRESLKWCRENYHNQEKAP